MDVNLKVLVVDDFATMRRIVKNILKDIGFTDISEAEDGAVALKQLQASPADLVICDWNMPNMSGLDLLKAVRADATLKATPFVMVTAEAQKTRVVEAVQAGVSNYIVKPFTADAVKEKLQKVLG